MRCIKKATIDNDQSIEDLFNNEKDKKLGIISKLKFAYILSEKLGIKDQIIDELSSILDYN